MRVLILCGGQGTRLASVLGGAPKALAPINGRPFLDYQLEALHQAGFVDIVLCTGIGHDQIAAHVRSRWGTNVHLSCESFPLGTAGAIRRARGWIQDTFMVVNGDTLINVNYHALIAWHRLWRSVCTLAAGLRSPTRVNGAVLRVGNPTAGADSGRIDAVWTQYTFGDLANSASHLVNAGLYVIDPIVLEAIQPDTVVSLDQDTLPLLVNRGAPCWAYTDDVEFFDIGTPERYQEAQTWFEGRSP